MNKQKYSSEVFFIKTAIIEAYNNNKNRLEYECREKMPFDVVTSVDYKIEEEIISKMNVLFSPGFVSDDTVVIQISDDRQVQKTLSCFNVRNIRYPLLIRSIGVEISIQ